MRRRNWPQILGLSALVLLLVGMLALVLAYRGQLIDLKHTIVNRCVQRQAYDMANHESIGADVTQLRFQVAAQRTQRPQVRTLIRSFPPRQRPVLREQEKAGLAALKADLASKEHAYAAGVIGSCSDFR